MIMLGLTFKTWLLSTTMFCHPAQLAKLSLSRETVRKLQRGEE